MDGDVGEESEGAASDCAQEAQTTSEFRTAELLTTVTVEELGEENGFDFAVGPTAPLWRGTKRKQQETDGEVEGENNDEEGGNEKRRRQGGVKHMTKGSR